MVFGELDDFDNSSSHGENRHQVPRQNGVPPSETEELDENVWGLREHDATSTTDSVKDAAATDGDASLFGAVKHRRTSSSTSEYSELKQRILALERKAVFSSNNDDSASIASKPTRADAKCDLGVILENGFQDSAEQQQIIPQILEKNWPDFMNKHTAENDEYAIEVLIGDPQYQNQKTTAVKSDRKHGKGRGTVPVLDSQNDPKPSERTNGQVPVANRIRINSMSILKALKNIDEHIDASASMVMMRPFKFLVHYEHQIRELVRILEQQLSPTESNTSQKATQEETLQHMHCLVGFMDRYIKPILSRLENISNRKISFRELWYLFKPGDDIYIPLHVQGGSITTDAISNTPEIFQNRYERSWKVTGTSGGRPNISVAQNRNANLKSNSFKVDCYYIDFYGKYYRPLVHTFEIMPFKGERDIISLDFYPSRYLAISYPERQAALNTITEGEGKTLFDGISRGFRHCYYSGPTLRRHPCGCSMENGPTIQEHIESEVIIDFKMTMLKHPSWRPPQEPWKEPVVERRELHETFPVQYWSDHSRTKLEHTEYDQVYNDYFIDMERAMIFKNNEQILAPIPTGLANNENMVHEKDYDLLPGRVFGFVLRTRTFAPLWLWGLQPIKAKIDGLHNLQLKDNTFKDTLQALVKTHFVQRQSHNLGNFEYDIVRGKGRGLVILLHGAPGVGKTFTAESIAAANGKPLFQITCGDLGLNPKEVDIALREIFHYAQHWKCVLLLDECDIFLTQRNKTDIKRNALVSIFLRVLEFYTGILFLTTNRVGALDEAIKSRITWISYYPPLNWPQTKAIWKTNIKRVQNGDKNLDVDMQGITKWAKNNFRKNLEEKIIWNGRRIQNAFKVATALAHWQTFSQEERNQTDQLTTEDDNDHRRSKLLAEHFEIYATGTWHFDKYSQSAVGFNDNERAFQAQERDDEFDPDDDTTVVLSDHNDGRQYPLNVPIKYEDPKRRPSMSLNVPTGLGRASSPNHRPQAGQRTSSSPLPQRPRSPTVSRHSATPTTPQMTQQRRRSSQVGALNTPVSSPVMRRPSNEHRASFDHDVIRQNYAEHQEWSYDYNEGTSNDVESGDYHHGNTPGEEYSSTDELETEYREFAA